MTGESDRAREKERLREERELQRLGAAQGVAIDTALFAPVASTSSAPPARTGFKRLNSDPRTTAAVGVPAVRPPSPPVAAALEPGPASRPRAAAFFDDDDGGAAPASAPAPPRAVIGTLAVGKRQRFAEMGKARPPPGAMMGDTAAATRSTAPPVMDDDGDDGDLLGARGAASAPAAGGKIKIQLGSLKPR